MLLFISHASEDQKDFVKPLADELAAIYDVWYAPYQLSLGDSLLQRINEGLAQCDFGIVVLSHAFFSKRWPKAELDGLFALEGSSRKIILPILKDISTEEVTKYSPILGGRLSVSASAGISRVVEEIRLAVDVSERKRQLTGVEAAVRKIKLVGQSLKEKKVAESLLHTEEGVKLIIQSAQDTFDILKSTLEQATNESDELKFSFTKFGNSNSIMGPYRVQLTLCLVGLYGNYGGEAVLQMRLMLHESRMQNKGCEELKEIDFKPSFKFSKKVIWIADGEEVLTYETDDLISYLIDLLAKEIEERSKLQL